MAFVTVYSDYYRAHPLLPNPPCRPEDRWAELKGGWLKDGEKQPEMNWSDEERAAFLRKANRDFFWTSTYTNDYCNKIKLEPRTGSPPPKKPKCGKTKGKTEQERTLSEAKEKEERQRKDKGENELMKAMKGVFERDPNRLVRQPLRTHKRILGYSTPSSYQCGFSIYQEDIGQPGYIYMRDNLIKPTVPENGHRPKHAIRPLFAVPEGERLLH